MANKISRAQHFPNGIKTKFGSDRPGKKNGRRIHKHNSPRFTQSSRSERTEGKSLFSRKVVSLEKIKHYLNIFACNARLKLHLYIDNDTRKELKESKDASWLEIKKLDTEETLQNDQNRFREAVEDGQVKEMVVQGANVVKGFAKKGLYAIKA